MLAWRSVFVAAQAAFARGTSAEQMSKEQLFKIHEPGFV
jgi:hypothetical protein